MKLFIKREQAQQKGFFGGNKGVLFKLSCRVAIDPGDRQLIEKYRADGYPLVFKDSLSGLLTHQQTSDSLQHEMTVGELVRGYTCDCKDVTALLHNEEAIKAGCQNFRSLLTVMASFGGEEVIEI